MKAEAILKKVGAKEKNVGDNLKNVGDFSKNLPRFFAVTPSFLSTNGGRKEEACEGCESKKCKIADGRAHTRTREGTFWMSHNPLVATNDAPYPH